MRSRASTAAAAGSAAVMTIASSILLIAIGAILAFAVTATVAGIDIQTIGVILMVAGAAGLAIALFLMTTRGSRDSGDDVYERREPRR